MKLELERQEFFKVWQTAEKFASTKSTKESIGGILITADENNTVTLEATDLRTSVKCSAPGVKVLEPGTAVVPASFVGAILKKLSAENFMLEFNSERGLLVADKNKTRFALIPVEEFPKIPLSENAELICNITASELGRLISEGSCASSQPQDFPKYMGTCLLRTENSDLKAVSTDGKRLSCSKCSCTVSKTEDLLLPSPALKELGKTLASYGDNIVKILADDSTVWFTLEGVEFSIRRIEAAFPNYERILNSEVHTTLRIKCSELSSVLDRIDIVAKTTPAHIMAMALQPNGEIRITARAPEIGTASEILHANIEGSYLQIGFNVGYFQDGLKALGPGEIVIEFSDEEGQTRMTRVESDDFLYMLMPARLSIQDAMTEEEIGDFKNSEEPLTPENIEQENSAPNENNY